jgi:6-pyruvoyltetrahydropterin/6-carboxytetrahydropterin synthase
MYRSTKVWGPFSAAFRQPGADSHCRFIHGYGLKFKATFEATHLDKNNWVMDFGGLKPIKAWLDEQFDHKIVISREDPLLSDFYALARKGGCELTVVSNVGCEAFARNAGLYVQQWLNDLEGNTIKVKDEQTILRMFGMSEYKRVKLYSMECMEHEANSAIWIQE